MTVNVTCQYTGIEFEAASKRSKNHPVVSRLLDEAVKDKHNPGRYSATKDALEAAKNAGMTDINEIVAFVNEVVTDGMDAARQRRNAEAEARRQQERQREEAKRQRQETNAYLRRHGYTWSKNDAYDFDSYEESDGSFVWELRSADGRLVTVAQALDEIERGVEVVLVEIAQAEADKVASEEAEQAAKDADNAAFEAVRDEAISGMVEVEALGIDRSEMRQVVRQVLPHATTIILRGDINGVPVAAIERYTSDYDSFTYYCADPAAVGLTTVTKPEPGSLSETLSAFFGE